MTRTLISMPIIAAAAAVGLYSVAPAAAVREEPLPQIVDIGPQIQAIGRWAVSEHVKQTSDGLSFNRVLGFGKEKVVAGTKYKLAIEATRDAKSAVVYEKEPTKMRQLLSFAPMHSSAF